MALVICGLAVYPTGLETSLNSALITGQQTVIVQQSDLTESLFQQLSLFSNYFGHTYFGVFSSGKTFQETPIWGDFFFPNTSLYYTSYLSSGFFTAIAGAFLIAIYVTAKPKKL